MKSRRPVYRPADPLDELKRLDREILAASRDGSATGVASLLILLHEWLRAYRAYCAQQRPTVSR